MRTGPYVDTKERRTPCLPDFIAQALVSYIRPVEYKIKSISCLFYLGQEVVTLVDALLLVVELQAPLLHHLLQPRQACALQHHPLVYLFGGVRTRERTRTRARAGTIKRAERSPLFRVGSSAC